MSVAHVARNALNRRMLPEMVRKAARRVTGRRHAAAAPEAKRWAASVAVDLRDGLGGVDDSTWNRSVEWASRFEPIARQRLETSPYRIGGGGNYLLLHHLVSTRCPSTVVETGVAAGWSSEAVLRAMADLGHGHLYSSDLPYFRLPRPERYVGLVVSDDVRDRWTLSTVGDRVALPGLVAEAGTVDLFHYDSDKTYEGRDFAARVVGPALAPTACEVWDDIQDNWHFRDRMAEIDAPSFVCEFQGKFVGVIDRYRLDAAR